MVKLFLVTKRINKLILIEGYTVNKEINQKPILPFKSLGKIKELKKDRIDIF